jgi:hypothetical protein
MRSELKDWVRSVLLDSESISRGYFNRGCLEHLIDQDLRFQSYPKEILSLVSLELWHRAFLDPSAATSGITDHVSLAIGN